MIKKIALSTVLFLHVVAAVKALPSIDTQSLSLENKRNIASIKACLNALKNQDMTDEQIYVLTQQFLLGETDAASAAQVGKVALMGTGILATALVTGCFCGYVLSYEMQRIDN